MRRLNILKFLLFNILVLINFQFIFLIILDIYTFASDKNIENNSSFCVVLCYHNIKVKADNEYNVELTEFEKQMQYLYDNNFTSLFASEVVQLLAENKNITSSNSYDKDQNKKNQLNNNLNNNSKNSNSNIKKYVAITFDDGNDGVYLYADKILAKYGLKATLYIYPSIIFSKKTKRLKHYMTFSQIAELIKTNRYELGCHSYYHPYMTKEDEKGLILNTIKAKETLFNQIGFDSKTFAYPFGLYNDKVVDYVRKAGFIGAFTIDRKYVNKNTDIYKIPRFLILKSTNFNEFKKIIDNLK